MSYIGKHIDDYSSRFRSKTKISLYICTFYATPLLYTVCPQKMLKLQVVIEQFRATIWVHTNVDA